MPVPGYPTRPCDGWCRPTTTEAAPRKRREGLRRREWVCETGANIYDEGISMPTATTLGQTGLQGWREKVADGIAEPVARRAPLDSEQVRALLGAAFFVLSVVYVVKTLTAATREARQG